MVKLTLFWTNVAIAVFALAAMIVVCFRRSTQRRTAAIFLASFYIVMLVSFYKMAADYPFTCTIDFRYVSPTAIVGAVFIGMFLKSIIDKNQAMGNAVTSCVGIMTFVFAGLTALAYSAIP